MKKLSKILTFGLSLSLLAACGSSKSNASEFGKITDGKDYIAQNNDGGKTGTLQDLYENLYSNEEAFNLLVAEIAKQELGLTYNKTTHTWSEADTEDDYDYVEIIKERRAEYLDLTSKEYTSSNATSGIVTLFDEEILVETLTKNGYTIGCSNGYGPTLNSDWTYDEDKKFLCDYTDLYEKTLDTQILIDLLSEKYILEENITSITKQQVRKVKYLSLAKGTYETVEGENEDRKINDTNLTSDFVHDVVLAGLKDGSKSLEDIEAIWKGYKTSAIEFKAEDACSYDSDSSYTECSSYTDNATISLEDGVRRQVLEVLNDTYVLEDVLTNTDTSVFNETINGFLFSDTTASRLHTVNGKTYLVSTALPAGQKVFTDENIIITNTANSSYQFIEVTIIDENTEDADLLLEAAKVIVENDAEAYEDALEFYLSKYNVTVHTESFEEFLEKSFPSIKFYR